MKNDNQIKQMKQKQTKSVKKEDNSKVPINSTKPSGKISKSISNNREIKLNNTKTEEKHENKIKDNKSISLYPFNKNNSEYSYYSDEDEKNLIQVQNENKTNDAKKENTNNNEVNSSEYYYSDENPDKLEVEKTLFVSKTNPQNLPATNLSDSSIITIEAKYEIKHGQQELKPNQETKDNSSTDDDPIILSVSKPSKSDATELIQDDEKKNENAEENTKTDDKYQNKNVDKDKAAYILQKLKEIGKNKRAGKYANKQNKTNKSPSIINKTKDELSTKTEKKSEIIPPKNTIPNKDNEQKTNQNNNDKKEQQQNQNANKIVSLKPQQNQKRRTLQSQEELIRSRNADIKTQEKKETTNEEKHNIAFNKEKAKNLPDLERPNKNSYIPFSFYKSKFTKDNQTAKIEPTSYKQTNKTKNYEPKNTSKSIKSGNQIDIETPPKVNKTTKKEFAGGKSPYIPTKTFNTSSFGDKTKKAKKK